MCRPQGSERCRKSGSALDAAHGRAHTELAGSGPGGGACVGVEPPRWSLPSYDRANSGVARGVERPVANLVATAWAYNAARAWSGSD